MTFYEIIKVTMKKAAAILILCIALLCLTGRVSAGDIDDVRAQVFAWSEAWQNRDINTYMSFYSPRFQSKGLDFERWREKKAEVFQQVSSIQVKISDLWVFIEGKQAVVSFIQRYSHPMFADMGVKTLVMVDAGFAWQIVSEEWKPMVMSGRPDHSAKEAGKVAELNTKSQTEAKNIAELKIKSQAETGNRTELDIKPQAETGNIAELKIKSQAETGNIVELKIKPQAETGNIAELKIKPQKINQEEQSVEDQEAATGATEAKSVAELDTRPQTEAKNIVELNTKTQQATQEQQGLEAKKSSTGKTVVKSIRFEIEKEMEKVFIDLNKYAIPRVRTLEGDKPRIVLDFMNAASWRGPFRIPANGKLVKQVRAYLHRKVGKLRIVLDLNPAEDYIVDQTFYKAENIYCITVQ